MNYFEKHIGDYIKNTAHLSMIEDGAYNRLIDAYYTREGALPANIKDCCKLARASSKPERDAVAYVLEEFFELREDGYHQPRCDEEIAKYLELEPEREAKREAERERQRKSRERRRELFSELREHGIVPPYNTTTAELQTLLGRAKSQQTNDVRHAPVTRDNAVTSEPVTRDVTATSPQSPVPTTQYKNQEAGEVVNSVSPSAASPNGIFRMHRHWQPGNLFSDALVFAGLKDYPFEDDLPEFVLFWQGKSEQLSQGSWEHKFIQSMKRNAARREQAGNEPTRIPTNWQPNRDLVAALVREGIPNDFVDASALEFLAFWREDGSAQRSWNARFIQHVRAQFDRAPPSEKSFLEKHFDRSWAVGLDAANALTGGDDHE